MHFLSVFWPIYVIIERRFEGNYFYSSKPLQISHGLSQILGPPLGGTMLGPYGSMTKVSYGFYDVLRGV
jgi:hypothetical protein